MDSGIEDDKVDEFRKILEIRSEDGIFKHIAFDQCFLRLIACTHLGNVYIFDLDKMSLVSFKEVGLNCSTIALNSGCALIGTETGFVRCIDTDTGTIVSERACFENDSEAGPVVNVDLKPGNEVSFALSSLNCNILIWDVPKLNPRFRLRGPTNVIQAFYTMDGSSIVTCHLNTSIDIWDVAGLKPKKEMPLREDSNLNITTVAINRDNSVIIAGSELGKLFYWDTEKSPEINIVRLPQNQKADPVIRVAFVNPAHVAVATASGKLYILKADTWEICDTYNITDDICRASFDNLVKNYCAVVETTNGCIRIVKFPEPRDRNLIAEPRKVVGAERISSNEDANKKHIEMVEKLNPERLRKIVKNHGNFSESKRCIIWKHVLQLPNNKDAFKALRARGIHPAFKKDVLKMVDGFDDETMERFRVLLSALAHWTPLLGEVTQLPKMFEPFFRLYQINLKICFETAATVLINWCANYYEFFPAPPVPILAELELVIEKRDKSLVDHLVRTGVTTQGYLWPMLSTLLGQILPGDEWSNVWDHIIVHPINFLNYVIAAYVLLSKQALLRLKDRDNIENYFRQPNAISVSLLLREAYKIYKEVPPVVFGNKILEMVPLTEGLYPVFVNYPKVSVDYRLRETGKIRADLDEWKRQRDAVSKLEAEFGKPHEEEERWREKEAALRVAENFRRQVMIEEEAKLAQQRAAIKQRTRELRQRELDMWQLHCRGIRRDRFLDREIYVERMEDDVVRKHQLRDQELLDALDDAEARNFRYQTDLLKVDAGMGIETNAIRASLRHDSNNAAEMMKNEVDVESSIMSIDEINRIRRHVARSNNPVATGAPSGTLQPATTASSTWQTSSKGQ